MENALQKTMTAYMGDMKQKHREGEPLTEDYWPSLEKINEDIGESLDSEYDRIALGLWYEIGMQSFPARAMLAEVIEMNGLEVSRSKRLVCAVNGFVLDPRYDTAMKREELAEYKWLLVSGTSKDEPFVKYRDGDG